MLSRRCTVLICCVSLGAASCVSQYPQGEGTYDPARLRGRQVKGVVGLRFVYLGSAGNGGEVPQFDFSALPNPLYLKATIGVSAGVRVRDRVGFKLRLNSIDSYHNPYVVLNQFSLQAEAYWPVTRRHEITFSLTYVADATLLFFDPRGWQGIDFDPGEGWKGGTGVGFEVALCTKHKGGGQWRFGYAYDSLVFTELVASGSSSAVTDSMGLGYIYVGTEFHF